jgi:hypothetical protein
VVVVVVVDVDAVGLLDALVVVVVGMLDALVVVVVGVLDPLVVVVVGVLDALVVVVVVVAVAVGLGVVLVELLTVRDGLVLGVHFEVCALAPDDWVTIAVRASASVAAPTAAVAIGRRGRPVRWRCFLPTWRGADGT